MYDNLNLSGLFNLELEVEVLKAKYVKCYMEELIKYDTPSTKESIKKVVNEKIDKLKEEYIIKAKELFLLKLNTNPSLKEQ